MRTDLPSRLIAACALFAAAGGITRAQSAPAQSSTAQTSAAQAGNPAPAAANNAVPAQPARLPTVSDRRRAAKLFLAAATMYKAELFEQALQDYEEAANLDPTNGYYSMAADVARSHAVNALIQKAARERTRGDMAGASATLQHALTVDPGNADASDHLNNLADSTADSAGFDSTSNIPQLASPIHLLPASGTQSFHMRAPSRQLIERVFKAFGVSATVDDSVRNMSVRLDVDDLDFDQAVHALELITNSFHVPIDSRHVVVARDTRVMREQYMHNAVETFYLSGLNSTEMTDMGNIARNVFNVRHTAINSTAGTLTLEAPELDLAAFNTTYSGLMQGQPQVVLDVRLVQLAHSRTMNTGVQPPQTFTAFNVYAEEQQLLSQNASLVQEIISSGLASPGDTLTILGILLASGQISSSLFSNGIALFGGGLTLSGISPAPATLNLNLNSSDSRELDDYQLRLGDNEDGSMKVGTHYPIESSILGGTGTGLNIPGLNLPGTSGSLGSLLSSVTGSIPNVPQIQYQDLGLVLKVRPRILRSNRVALTVDLNVTALAGTSINGVPVLANRSYSGVMTMPANNSVVIAGELDKNETRAISGLPGLSEIPGLNNVTEKTTDQNYSTLLIILTPRVVRGPYGMFHGPMVRVERDSTSR